MNRRSSFRFLAAGLAFALLLAASASTPAATVFVGADSGGSSADINGTKAGATFSSSTYLDNVSSVGPLGSPLTTISVNIPLTFSVTVVTSAGGVVDSWSGTETLTENGKTVTMTMSGTGADGSFYTKGVLALDGTITNVSGQPVPDTMSATTWNFASLVNGTSSITLTAKSGQSFLPLLNHDGAKMKGVGIGLTGAAVPEPASLALFGIGMTGFLAFRRFSKKTPVA